MQSRYKHIPIEVLRAFVIISETGSFTKAANELNLSQSAVSLQIKRLQQLVGSDVFAKSPLGHSLTDQGKQLDHYARRIVALNDQILAFSGNASHGPTVRVGVQNSFAERFLPSVIKGCNAADTATQIQFVCESASSLWGMLADGYLDIAFTLAPLERSMSPHIEWEEKLIWACAPDLSLSRNDFVPLIVLPGGFIDSRAINTLEQNNIPYKIVFRAGDMSARKAAAVAGIGLKVTPERCMHEELSVAREPWLPSLPKLRGGVFLKEGLDMKRTKKIVNAFVEAVIPIRVSSPKSASIFHTEKSKTLRHLGRSK